MNEDNKSIYAVSEDGQLWQINIVTKVAAPVLDLCSLSYETREKIANISIENILKNEVACRRNDE